MVVEAHGGGAGRLGLMRKNTRGRRKKKKFALVSVAVLASSERIAFFGDIIFVCCWGFCLEG